MTLKISALTKLGLFFPVVCFIYVFDQTLAEQLYRDKGPLPWWLGLSKHVKRELDQYSPIRTSRSVNKIYLLTFLKLIPKLLRHTVATQKTLYYCYDEDLAPELRQHFIVVQRIYT